MDQEKTKKMAEFFYEIGTMRKIPRAHQQMLLTQDLSDNISSHSYRVTLIAWFLAKAEGVDPYKTVMMALLHDTEEVRSSDHNYVHKKYAKIYSDEILKDQLGELPFNEELIDIKQEYEERRSPEAIVAKDADLIDQIILLKEYAHQGNKEAEIWLNGKGNTDKENVQFKNLKTESAKKIGQEVLDGDITDWWKDFWTHENR